MRLSETFPLVLGSRSPRRRDILASLGLPFRALAGDADEERRASETAGDYIARVVRAKLADVVQRIEEGERVAGVLVADTIVVLDDDVLGKPRDVADAERLLGRIAGRTHFVRTRYALSLSPDLGVAAVERTVESKVTLRSASADELRRYAATGEGLDKAGAYAAQGIGAFLVERIDGSFSNVVGLPACEVVLDLVRTGLVDEYPAARR
jgi:septum formation protein